jgi:parallel beta-helix repeat protein
MLKLAFGRGVMRVSNKNGCMFMKKRLELFVILLTMVFVIAGLGNRMLFPVVRATYVEGAITQNTTWTLVDSPFVLSGNVTVYQNATLTIEPGVEVKFGGEFSLFINGKLLADGTDEKMITFTSNEQNPKAGDWKTIAFISTQASSLTHCIIEYGVNGTTVASGSLNIQNSKVNWNSQNGIVITNGNVVVENSDIANNAMSGILVSGSNQVTVRKNSIMSNGDGITLLGNSILNLNIDQNSVSFNSQTGILLGADDYGNTVIINNTLSANHDGFYASTATPTHISRNYIRNNDIGFYYEKGASHTANFNDIYNNTLAMGASSDATVNATHNYWGEASGPYHASLNPHGKGNPVEGDGVNVDFVFFLSAPIDYSNSPPTPVLWKDKAIVARGQNVAFVGADSYDDGRVDQYFYDFGDGTTSGWTTLSILFHNYSATGTYDARLKVMDDFGVESSYVSTSVNVQNLSSLLASVTLESYSVDSNKDVSVTVYVSDGTDPVENANVTLFSVKGGSYAPQSGSTDADGHFTANFTAPSVAGLVNVRIIATASQPGFADGSDYKYLKVLPPLAVQVSAQSSTIAAEKSTVVTVLVTSDFDEPVANASITLSVDNGNLSAFSGITDQNGNFSSAFTAPITTVTLNATVSVNAAKSGFVDGRGQTIISVLPKMLNVQITPERTTITSEAKVNVTVHVAYDAMPVQQANISIASASGGNFPATTGLTDAYGDSIFTFIAPQANTPLNITITAHASKATYADGDGTLNITVTPGVLSVEVKSASPSVRSRETSVVTVLVTFNSTSVANAQVTVSVDNGNFSGTTAISDVNGSCTFIFNAPVTTTYLSAVITANATKNGFISAENQTRINIAPEVTPQAEGGWPWWTVLLIVIPIVIVVIVVVLIKLKIITVSSKAEE